MTPKKILLTACSLALAAGFAATAFAAATPKAQVDAKVLSPRAAQLVKTPGGKKLVVAVPVRYRLHVGGDSTAGARMTVRLSGRAKLPGGRTLAAAADSRRLSGASERTVDHHLFFSAAQTRQLLAAGKGATIATQASISVRTEGGAEASVEAEGSAPLPQPTPPSEEETAPGDELGHARGNDPCGYYGLKNCENVSGPTVKTTFWFQHRTEGIRCPNKSHPWPTDRVTDETSSAHYAQDVNVENKEAVVELIDYNFSGHPYSYHFWLACSTEQQEEGPPPGIARPVP